MKAQFITVTDQEYFDDKLGVDVPVFSASAAKTLLAKSPQHAWIEHPKGGNRRKISSKAMDFGSIIHAVLLGKGGKVAVIESVETAKGEKKPAENYQTKDAQRQRDEAIAKGLIPMLPKEWDKIAAAATSVSQRLTEQNVSLDGKAEQTAMWEQNGVICKCRMDMYHPPQELITELKITDWPLSQKSLERLVIQLGYDVQLGAYLSAMAAMGVAPMFRWIYIEAEYPYSVVVAWPSDLLIELGKQKWNRAVEEWRKCLETNTWAGYPSERTLDAPMWALRECEISVYPVTEEIGADPNRPEKPEGVAQEDWF